MSTSRLVANVSCQVFKDTPQSSLAVQQYSRRLNCGLVSLTIDNADLLSTVQSKILIRINAPLPAGITIMACTISKSGTRLDVTKTMAGNSLADGAQVDVAFLITRD